MHCYIYYAGISLEKSGYIVFEREGSLEVCAVLSGTVLPADPFLVTLSTLNVSDSGAALASGTCIDSHAVTFLLYASYNSHNYV